MQRRDGEGPAAGGAPGAARPGAARLRRVVLGVFGLAVVIQGASSIIVPRGDLGNHVAWARRLLAGGDLYAGGLNLPYTPAWALAHVPLAVLPPRAAAALTFLAGLLAAALVLAVLHRLVRAEGPTREETFLADAVALLLAGRFVLRDLADGGPNLALLALVLVGLLLHSRGRDAAGGALVGVAAALKWTPGLFLAWLAWKREWRAAAAGLATAAVVTAAPALFAGPAWLARHLETWGRNVAAGVASPDPSVGVLGAEPVRNLAFRPALGRLLAAPPPGHDALRDGPWPGLLSLPPRTAAVATALAALALLALVAARCRGPLRARNAPEVPAEIAAVALLALLLSPIAWRSHAVAALPALFLLAHRALLRGHARRAELAFLAAWVPLVLLPGRDLVGAHASDALLAWGTPTALLLALLGLVLAERRASPAFRAPRRPRFDDAVGPAWVVVPTYEEARNLPVLSERLLALPAGVRLVVVDDASPDGTGKIAEEIAHAHPGRVAVVHRAGKLGLGTAYLEGIAAALAAGAGRVVTMDADLSHPPDRLPALLDAASDADLVVGSRYVADGGAVDSPPFRKLLSRTANLGAHAALGLATRDATAGFRVWRRDAATMLVSAGLVSSGYSFLLEATFLAEERGLAVAEVPILFRDRREGRSKISRDEIAKAVATVGRLALRRLRRLVAAPAGAAA